MIGFTDVQKHQGYVYTYYPDGRRSSKSITSELKSETSQSTKIKTESIGFLYGHQGNLLNEEYSQDSQLQKRSSYFAGLRFIDDLINKNDSVFQFPLADQHNHPATVSFSQGQSKIESYHLTDYGQLEQANLNASNIEGTESQTEKAHSTEPDNQNLINFMINPKVYGSGYYDPESNLQYMGARYYSAETQRFMAQDSYNLLNRYNYANGNPVMNYDPDGHSAVGSIVNHLTPKGVGGVLGLGVSIGVDMAITSIALGANPSLGTLMFIGAVSGGLSNGLGTMAAESVEAGKINAADVRAQVLLGVVIGGVMGGLPGLSKSIYKYRSGGYKFSGKPSIPPAPDPRTLMPEKANINIFRNPIFPPNNNRVSPRNLYIHATGKKEIDVTNVTFKNAHASEEKIYHVDIEYPNTDYGNGQPGVYNITRHKKYDTYFMVDSRPNLRGHPTQHLDSYTYCPICKSEVPEGDSIENVLHTGFNYPGNRVVYEADKNQFKMEKVFTGPAWK